MASVQSDDIQGLSLSPAYNHEWFDANVMKVIRLVIPRGLLY